MLYAGLVLSGTLIARLLSLGLAGLGIRLLWGVF